MNITSLTILVLKLDIYLNYYNYVNSICLLIKEGSYKKLN